MFFFSYAVFVTQNKENVNIKRKAYRFLNDTPVLFVLFKYSSLHFQHIVFQYEEQEYGDEQDQQSYKCYAEADLSAFPNKEQYADECCDEDSQGYGTPHRGTGFPDHLFHHALHSPFADAPAEGTA